MNAPESVRRMRLTSPMVALSALFVAAGGFVHLREWLDLYRHVPAGAPGAAMVRVGFPLNAAASAVIVIALALVFRRRSRLTMPVVLAALAFQAASLAALVATRMGTVFGWSEPTWTPAALETGAVEVAAVVTLTALAVLARREGAARPTPTATPAVATAH